jgi:alpha-L-rhamnosidase
MEQGFMNRRKALAFGGSLLAALAAGAVRAADEDGKVKADKPAEDNGATRHEVATYGPPNEAFLAKAEAFKPKLIETVQLPLGLIQPVEDKSQALGWRIEAVATADEIAGKVLKKGDSFIIDFGGHRTGNLSFQLNGVGRGVDAPARLRFIFGEVISDVAEPLHPYKGQLSEAWLPEEIVTIDYLPQAVRLPRRYAFRFVKVEVIDTSPNFGISFVDLKAHGLSSASGTFKPLPAGTPADLVRIDEVAAATLRDCMQTTFEDGPRRDQRLWTGDLRLQALTNYVTFENIDLVKRCLYLIAAFPRSDGLVAGCVFEYPKPAHGHEFLGDYAVFFAVTLADYVAATGDIETGKDLWPVALRQLEVLRQYVGADNVITAPKDLWVFIDWHPQLEKAACFQAVYIYGLKRVEELAGRLGATADVQGFDSRIKAMETAALAHFFDRKQGVFVSGASAQVSLASQAWMTVAGVGTKGQRAKALKIAMAKPDTVRPITPYLNHYVVEALMLNGMKAEGLEMLRAYWGGMVKAGADTFWEAYSPDEPRAAPYGDFHINSFCHAWSCTPSYLLRKYNFT